MTSRLSLKTYYPRGAPDRGNASASIEYPCRRNFLDGKYMGLALTRRTPSNDTNGRLFVLNSNKSHVHASHCFAIKSSVVL